MHSNYNSSGEEGKNVNLPGCPGLFVFQTGYVMFSSTSMKKGEQMCLHVNITVFIFTLAISKWPN